MLFYHVEMVFYRARWNGILCWDVVCLRWNGVFLCWDVVFLRWNGSYDYQVEMVCYNV